MKKRLDLSALTFQKKENIYIGGNQSWYKTYTQKIGACGTVSATNMLIHLAKSNPKYKNLYEMENNYNSYILFMNEIYDYVKPNEFYQAHKKSQAWKLLGKEIPPSFGILNQNRIAKGIRKYGKSKGVSLTFRKLKRPSNYEALKTFIGDGLQMGRPIAIRNMFNGVKMQFVSPFSKHVREVDYKLHWVTIIGIIEGEKTEIEVLTWAGIGKINLEDFWSVNKGHGLFPIRALYIE